MAHRCLAWAAASNRSGRLRRLSTLCSLSSGLRVAFIIAI
jgi:hypothetical protein